MRHHFLLKYKAPVPAGKEYPTSYQSTRPPRGRCTCATVGTCNPAWSLRLGRRPSRVNYLSNCMHITFRRRVVYSYTKTSTCSSSQIVRVISKCKYNRQAYMRNEQETANILRLHTNKRYKRRSLELQPFQSITDRTLCS